MFSSGAIGRLVADDVVGFIRCLIEHPEAPKRDSCRAGC
jgi:hypothetical protein